MKKRVSSLLLIGLLGWSGQAAWSDSLYVFVPTDVRTKILQDKIEAACPGLTVTVFGRGQDFRKQVESSKPDAILTLMPVIEKSTGYQSSFRGMKDGQPVESYYVVSKDTAIGLDALAGKTVGVVDLLGRKPMTEYVHQILNVDVKVKRVTKTEDLLPLLTFGAADAVFVSQSVFESLKEKTELNLVNTEINVKIGLTAAATSGAAAKEKYNDCIMQFDDELNAMLGVEKWTTN